MRLDTRLVIIFISSHAAKRVASLPCETFGYTWIFATFCMSSSGRQHCTRESYFNYQENALYLSGVRQIVRTHRASVHQAAKLVVLQWMFSAEVTAGLAESNGSLPPGLWLTSPAGWLPRTGISSGTLRSVIEYTGYLYRLLLNTGKLGLGIMFTTRLSGLLLAPSSAAYRPIDDRSWQPLIGTSNTLHQARFCTLVTAPANEEI